MWSFWPYRESANDKKTMHAVQLHAVQTPAKVLLPAFARRTAPVFFVVLHGFLAHSGAVNSFVTMLRNALDAHNHTILQNNDTSSHVLPFHITTLDARNHGLSPHTSTHVLSNLVEDLDAYLTHQLPHTVQEVAQHLDVGQIHTYDDHPIGMKEVGTVSQRVRVIAVGHSMGSLTWTQYLMNRFEMQNSTSRTTAAKPLQSAPDVRCFVSMDMPPVTMSNVSVGLVEELVEMVEHMKKVDTSRIFDLRSAHDEFIRCGMQDIRVRGLCTTNLALTPDPANRARKVASWKCNLPVLERSIRTGELFFTNTYFKKPLSVGNSAEAIRIRRKEILSVPSVGEVPVLSILGAASPIGGDARYDNLWERYAVNLEQHTIPSASHTVYYDKPRETIDLLKSFLVHTHVL